jgi:hypothetical protein
MLWHVIIITAVQQQRISAYTKALFSEELKD